MAVVIGIRGAVDAYVAMLQAWPALAGVQILDGPTADAMELEGIAVGWSRTGAPVAQFTVPKIGMSSQRGSTSTLTCSVWSGSGETGFAAHRDRVEQLLDTAGAVLDADRTLRGSVSTAWIVGGVFAQEQTGGGALVVAEFRLDITRF